MIPQIGRVMITQSSKLTLLSQTNSQAHFAICSIKNNNQTPLTSEANLLSERPIVGKLNTNSYFMQQLNTALHARFDKTNSNKLPANYQIGDNNSLNISPTFKLSSPFVSSNLAPTTKSPSSSFFARISQFANKIRPKINNDSPDTQKEQPIAQTKMLSVTKQNDNLTAPKMPQSLLNELSEKLSQRFEILEIKENLHAKKTLLLTTKGHETYSQKFERLQQTERLKSKIEAMEKHIKN